MVLAVVLTMAVTGCEGASSPSKTSSGLVRIVAAENEYGDVASQIGGRYVSVTSIESNPNTDPHDYEVSASVAGSVASAAIVIENGVGYDSFMDGILASTSGHGRKVIDVQHLLGLPDSTANPHLWYDPTTMPAVARALAGDLAAVDPAHASYYSANADHFVQSLQPWLDAIAQFKAEHSGVPVATTEPVADYMLQAVGADNLTPFSFQADIMNGVDLSPQQVTLETDLLSQRKVKVFVYNQQVTDSVTEGFIHTAERAGVPVVGVYETMPVPGYDYQSWMLAEVDALLRAVTTGQSTQHL